MILLAAALWLHKWREDACLDWVFNWLDGQVVNQARRALKALCGSISCTVLLFLFYWCFFPINFSKDKRRKKAVQEKQNLLTFIVSQQVKQRQKGGNWDWKVCLKRKHLWFAIYLIFQTNLLQRTEYGEEPFLSLLSEGTYAGKKEDSGSPYGSLF